MKKNMIFFLQLNHIFSSNYFRSLKTILMLKIKKNNNNVSVRVRINCNPHTLLSEVQNGTATLENSRFFKFEIYLLCTKPLQSCPALWPYGMYTAMLLCPWDSPGKNTGVSCHAFLQGIFPTQGTEPTSLTSPTLTGGFLWPSNPAPK